MTPLHSTYYISHLINQSESEISDITLDDKLSRPRSFRSLSFCLFSATKHAPGIIVGATLPMDTGMAFPAWSDGGKELKNWPSFGVTHVSVVGEFGTMGIWMMFLEGEFVCERIDKGIVLSNGEAVTPPLIGFV